MSRLAGGFRCFGVILAGITALVARLTGADPVAFAEHFRIETVGGETRIDVMSGDRTVGGGAVYLIPGGGTMPSEIPEGVTVVRTPVERIVALSTTYLAALADLGAEDRIVAVGGSDLVTTPEIRERIDRGEIVGVGDSASIDLEALVALRPDVVFMSVFAMESFAGRSQLERLGIPVVPTAAYLEPHPLGRAEWIRFFGAFTGDADAAVDRFVAIAETYQEIGSRIAFQVPSSARPRVLTGAPWGGVWYCAGGRSYLARLIGDAGGTYVWNDESVASVPRDLETVLAGAGDAPIWIHVGAVETREAMLGMDRRFRFFRAWRDSAVFNNDLGAIPGGGIPFWERGAHRPDEVLADLGAILHPDLFPGHRFRYYRRLR